MNRNLLACVGVLLLVAASGCAMSDSSLDYNYGAYGGKWQRTDPCCGRVGSIIDPAGARVMSQQTKASPAQQPDDGPQSILAPEVDESLQEQSLDTEEPSLDLPPTDDLLSPLAEPADDPLIDLETETPKADPVELAPLELGPVDTDTELMDNVAPSDAPEEADIDPVDELPDFLEDLGIKREPVEPLQPLESGGLPSLMPSTDADR